MKTFCENFINIILKIKNIQQKYIDVDKWGQGVLAPGYICSLYLKFIFETSGHLKKSKKKLHVDLHIQHAHKVVSRKTNFCVAYVKRQKNQC
jgi:hypothetical protein